MTYLPQSHLLYGPPASGKSTIAHYLSQAWGSEYLSVGTITRQEIANKTAEGIQLEEYLNKVEEYPVELIAQVMGTHLHAVINSNKPFILDGFPKYPSEADKFVQMIHKEQIKIDAAIILEAPLEEIVQRAQRRRICERCLRQATLYDEKQSVCEFCHGHLITRDDDQPEYLKRRYDDHIQAVEPTLQILAPHINRIVRISALPPINQVVANIQDKISNKPE